MYVRKLSQMSKPSLAQLTLAAPRIRTLYEDFPRSTNSGLEQEPLEPVLSTLSLSLLTLKIMFRLVDVFLMLQDFQPLKANIKIFGEKAGNQIR